MIIIEYQQRNYICLSTWSERMRDKRTETQKVTQSFFLCCVGSQLKTKMKDPKLHIYIKCIIHIIQHTECIRISLICLRGFYCMSFCICMNVSVCVCSCEFRFRFYHPHKYLILFRTFLFIAFIIFSTQQFLCINNNKNRIHSDNFSC